MIGRVKSSRIMLATTLAGGSTSTKKGGRSKIAHCIVDGHKQMDDQLQPLVVLIHPMPSLRYEPYPRLSFKLIHLTETVSVHFHRSAPLAL